MINENLKFKIYNRKNIIGIILLKIYNLKYKIEIYYWKYIIENM